MKADAWFRAYTRLVDNPKLQTMDADLFRQLVNFWALTKLNGGVLPPAADIAWRLRLPVKKVEADIKALLAAPLRLLEKDGRGIRPTGWEEWQSRANTSAERMAAKRARDTKCDARSDGNVTRHVTQNVTDSVTQCDAGCDGVVTGNVTQRRGEEREIPPIPSESPVSKPPPQRAQRDPDFEPFHGPDPAALVAAAVEVCSQFWPAIGDKKFAIHSWQREAAKSTLGVEGWCEAIIPTARQHAAALEAAKRAGEKRFIPSLERWVSSGDYTSPPQKVIRREVGPQDLGENYSG